MKIRKSTWNKLREFLRDHQIPYTTHWETVIGRGAPGDPILWEDKHIQINLVVENFFGTEEEELPW